MYETHGSLLLVACLTSALRNLSDDELIRLQNRIASGEVDDELLGEILSDRER